MLPINLFDFEVLASNQLNSDIYDYYAGGSGNETTLKRNREIFDHIQLLPRVLQDTSQINLFTELLNIELSMPVIIAPMAFHMMAHPEGEIATAKAASDANIPLIVSMMSTVSLEEIRKNVNSSLWFQIYIAKNREITAQLVKRAKLANYQAIVVTVDVPIMARRERDLRNQFKLPKYVTPQNLLNMDFSLIHAEQENNSSVKYFTDNVFDRSLTWKDIEWLKSMTDLPIIVKGILRVEDAILAVEHGVSGIIISNHGGRQLDTLPTALEVLPGIVKAINGKIPILVDGGFRRGTDVLKALALGANCILLGRPILWGLTIDGQRGVHRILEIIREELYESMILSGYTSINDIKDNANVIVRFATNLNTALGESNR